MGAVAPEAIEAAGLMSEDRRGVGVLAVTSADRLSAGWHGAQRAREHGNSRRARTSRRCSRRCRATPASSRCATRIPRRCRGSAAVQGHRVRALGVEHFGQSGSISELYSHYGLDVEAIMAAAEGLLGRPVRYRTRVA